MRLTNDNFSYCKGVGLLKENFTRERALKSIYKDMEETPDLDRAFLREVGKATTTSSNVGTWVAVMYNYDIDVNYKKGGKTYNKKINDFGNTGTPDELDVTEYYGDGDYKTLTDVASQCSFPVWNKNNIFTFEEMKGALKSIIEDELPSGWQSYETVDWNVSAYLVPIFSIDIDIYGNEMTVENVRHNFPSCFAEHLYPGVPKLNMHVIEPHQRFMVGDIAVTPVEVMHGAMAILGYRFGRFAYITDMKSIHGSEMPYLRGVDTLVVNALRWEKPHQSHILVGEAIDFSRKIGARRTFLTHLTHLIGLHKEAEKRLPEGFHFAYDGLQIEVE